MDRKAPGGPSVSATLGDGFICGEAPGVCSHAMIAAMARRGHDPIAKFIRWLDDARRARIPNYETMALATAARSGKTSVRFVLLKGIDQRGFMFFTDARSRKGRELRGNPHTVVGVRHGRRHQSLGPVTIVLASRVALRKSSFGRRSAKSVSANTVECFDEPKGVAAVTTM